MFLYSILTIDSPYINAGYSRIDEWVFGWRLCASWTQSSDHSLRFGRRCLLSVCCSLRDGAPRRALYGPWHIDEQLYRSELCSALGAHSLLNQWANQSMLAHTQPTAEPLSGPSSLTLTPAQVAGDTLIHLSQAQTDSSHHIPAISILSISPSLTRSVTQTHFLSSVSHFPLRVSHCFILPVSMYSSISLPLHFSVPWSISKPPSRPPRLSRGSLPSLPPLTVGASRSGHGRRSSGQIDTHIIAYQYLLSMRAEMIGNWSCFDSPPPPSASGSSVWLQRASVELHKNVWKYLQYP